MNDYLQKIEALLYSEIVLEDKPYTEFWTYYVRKSSCLKNINVSVTPLQKNIKGLLFKCKGVLVINDDLYRRRSIIYYKKKDMIPLCYIIKRNLLSSILFSILSTFSSNYIEIPVETETVDNYRVIFNNRCISVPNKDDVINFFKQRKISYECMETEKEVKNVLAKLDKCFVEGEANIDVSLPKDKQRLLYYLTGEKIDFESLY